MDKFTDISGKTFNRLTAIAEAGFKVSRNGAKIHMYKFNCSCGNVVTLPKTSVTSGNTGSCGCYRREKVKNKNTTHNLSKNPAYSHWKDMHKRCRDRNGKYSKVYFEKGITVCSEFSSFEAFLADIGEKPEALDGKRWSVGRIDNLKGYVVGNIRWETDDQQARNHSLQRNNKTGCVGLQFRVKNGIPYWIATWKDSGSFKSKSFNINKYGFEKAKELAISTRHAAIMALELQGVFYSKSHGKVKLNETTKEESSP